MQGAWSSRVWMVAAVFFRSQSRYIVLKIVGRRQLPATTVARAGVLPCVRSPCVRAAEHFRRGAECEARLECTMGHINLKPGDVAAAIPAARDVVHVSDGGQKRVFRANIEGTTYAVKFMRPTVKQISTPEVAVDQSVIDDVTARAEREVEIMKRCTTPHLVKQGPIGLTAIDLHGERFLYFTEEFIDGDSLQAHLNLNRVLDVSELVRLGTHVTLAIDELWSMKCIHRDVKPGNIMMRKTGEFVLLDMGLVFDLDDESFSLGPVGTLAYFSPEQFDFRNRRSVLDFRSDTFSLGVVLYQMAARQHPFASGATNSWEILTNIQTQNPVPLHQLRGSIPDELNAIVMRLLGKRPALRYRTPKMLLDALRAVPLN